MYNKIKCNKLANWYNYKVCVRDIWKERKAVSLRMNTSRNFVFPQNL